MDPRGQPFAGVRGGGRVNVITATMELVETTAGVPFPALDPFGEGIVSLGEDDAEEQDWQERALCAQTDPEAFFPEKGGSIGRRYRKIGVYRILERKKRIKK